MTRLPLLVAAAVAATAAYVLFGGAHLPGGAVLPSGVAWAALIVGGLITLHELLGRPLLFMRWSFLRIVFGMKRMLTEWQVGDGREEAVARFVVSKAPKGDIDAAIAAIDEYAYRHKFLMNVGDKKGALLDGVIERMKPKRVLELGAYVGYSALRIARKLPTGGHLYSVEFSAANAAIARRIVEHAGATDRVTFVHGFLGDGGKTLAHLANDLGFAAESLDVAFIDHAKDAYLPDLQSILQSGWLRPGAVVVADNVGFPGAPGYREYMESEEGKRWRTTAHQAHLEYQSVLPDVVLESTLLR